MRKIRAQALILACLMAISIILAGCGSKKSGKDRDENRRASAMLDDFCAYLKSGKYDKMDKLVDGSSKELERLKDISNSETKELLDAARKRISYTVSDVSVSDDEGEAILTVTYFDVNEVKKGKSGGSARDLKSLINAAKEDELDFSVKLSYDEDWLIDDKSADEILSDLFDFIGELDIDTKPTTAAPSTSAAQNLTELSSTWYDDQFNYVQAYHQSADFIRFMVVFWENCYGETVTYEFCDENYNIYQDSCVVDNGDNFVYCDWSPDYMLPTGWISCTVYDGNNNIITVGCIEIVADTEPIPQQLYVLDCHMVDAVGKAVPGYTVDTDYIAAEITVDHAASDTVINYEYYRMADDLSLHSDVLCFRGSVNADTTTLNLPWLEVKDPEPGDYYVLIFDVHQTSLRSIEFKVLDKGQSFKPDSRDATFFTETWCEEPDMKNALDKLSKRAKCVFYQVHTVESFDYMELTYEVADGEGKVFQSGNTTICASDKAEIIEIPLDIDIKGSLTIRTYTPSGKLLRESTIEEET